MRFRLLAVLAVTLFASTLASAQPRDAGPTIEVRLRSVNDLVDRFEYVAGLAGKEDAVKQVRELIKVLSADGKGVEGIDPKKPMGAYATLVKEVETSPFVLMVPIADEEQFLKALDKHLQITPEKNKDGTYKFTVPFVNEVNLRFANGYLYASPKANALDPKGLVKPAAFFAKDDGSVASVLVHLDRVPADLRTFILGQLELGIAEARKKNAENESPAEKRFKNLALDAVLAGLKGLTDDGKDLSVKLFADGKTDEISAEVTFTAKSGSATAKNFAALGGKMSLPAGIVAASDPAARASAKVAVTEGMKKDYTAAVDALLAELVKKAPADQEEVAKQVVAAISPTLKAGELDAAGALVGPDAKGRYRFVAAFAVTEGKGVEKLLKDLEKQFGDAIAGFVTFKFDAETIGDFKLHRIELKQTDDKFDKLFGTGNIWLAISDKHIALSIEPDGDTIKKGLKAKAVPVPVVSVDVSVAKVLQLAQPDLKPDELKALLKDAFGDGPTTGKDTLSVSVEGGEQLTAKLKVKGKALRLFAGLGLLKGN